MAKKFMLDGHCYDYLTNDGLAGKLGELHESGDCLVYTSQAQIVEFAQIPDERLEKRLAHFHAVATVRPRVAATAYRWDTPLVGFPTFASDEEIEQFKALAVGRESELESHEWDDTMIVAAGRIGAIFVTHDARARKRAERTEVCQCWSYSELVEWMSAGTDG